MTTPREIHLTLEERQALLRSLWACARYIDDQGNIVITEDGKPKSAHRLLFKLSSEGY